MPRIMHNLLCTISRRYRVAHCRHVDELPPRMSKRLRDECSELDPRSWETAKDMIEDLRREYEEEDRAETASRRGSAFGKAAVFA